MELKACPFCGLEHINDVYLDEEGYANCQRCGSVRLPLCFWNTRPIEDRLTAENKRLRGALENIASHLKTLSGSMVEYSVTYEIARKALEEKP